MDRALFSRYITINQARRSQGRSAASSRFAGGALIGRNPDEKNEKYPFQTGLLPAEPVGLRVIGCWPDVPAGCGSVAVRLKAARERELSLV